MWHQVLTPQNLYVQPTQWVYVLYMDLGINSEYFPITR
jgi:hypothetical protein